MPPVVPRRPFLRLPPLRSAANDGVGIAIIAPATAERQKR
jgi:hypothetical protein